MRVGASEDCASIVVKQRADVRTERSLLESTVVRILLATRERRPRCCCAQALPTAGLGVGSAAPSMSSAALRPPALELALYRHGDTLNRFAHLGRVLKTCIGNELSDSLWNTLRKSSQCTEGVATPAIRALAR